MDGAIISLLYIDAHPTTKGTGWLDAQLTICERDLKISRKARIAEDTITGMLSEYRKGNVITDSWVIWHEFELGFFKRN